MMAEKERKRADDLPVGAVEQVRELLNRPRSSADLSPAARYAVSRLGDYAEQEQELREKAETIICNERRKALAFSAEMARQERTIDDLRQQLSFMRQVMHGRWAHLGGDEWCCSACGFVITTEGSWDKPTKKHCEDCGARMDGDFDNG